MPNPASFPAPGAAWIDFAQPLADGAPRLRLALGAPLHRLVAWQAQEVRGVLDAVQAAAAAGHWCVGGLRYEAAAAFDPALHTHAADGPLAWFGVHAAPLPWPDDRGGPMDARVQWQAGPERAAFDAALAHIAQAIAAGDYYQVNYTAPLHGVLQAGDGAALFAALQRAQPGGYALCMDMGAEQVLSVSPELFFDWQDAPGGGDILARPMKGTAARGATPADDAAQAAQLAASTKERAENVMIVDLLRNDLSRIAAPHSVQVPRLFHTEALPTVWQMTSDVRARTRVGVTLTDVFGALFPCGSVTGAPKVRAMQAIAALESTPRGLYCGALGVVRPCAGGAVRATFNVPIRTVVLRGAQLQCGIGSGITAGSQAAAEWQEWQHKRAFIERASEPFELLETLRLRAGQYPHAPLHLVRMQQSAAHFGFACDAVQLRQCLDDLACANAQGTWRVRLVLAASGACRAQAAPLAETIEPVRLQLATRPLDEAHGEFVRHKTTRRAHYAAFAPAADSGVFDTILYNAAGEITETTFGNVAALLDGRWITPPLACGLLPGVGRALALQSGRVQEARLHRDDVPRVQAWAFVNSLRGWLAAERVGWP